MEWKKGSRTLDDHLMQNPIGRKRMRGRFNKAGVAVLALLLAALLLTTPVAGAPGNVLKIPLLAYRTGPYAAGGSGFVGGNEDYFALLNARGGLEGVTLQWDECEFGYDTARGVECYERNKRDMPFVFPSSTGVTFALLDRLVKDQIPGVTIGYGRSDATDGKTFPWMFPVIGNYWSQAAAFVRYLAARERGEANLRGKRIALLHLDIPYGREPIAAFEALAKRFGFEFRNFPLPAPGIEQSAAWLDITRRFQADYVIQWNFGVSCTVPFTEMQKVGFPRDRFLGVWWCGSEEDVRPAGDLAFGYVSANFTGVGRNFPVIKQILETVHAKGKGNIETARVGTIYYNRGVVWAIIITEAIGDAIRREGLPVTGSKVRAALERLNIDEARLRQLGAAGLLPTVKLSAENHGGVQGAWFQRWDGKEWKRLPGFWEPYEDVVWELIRASAAKYREGK
jgi:branched-chain amino acid transport system substrate-binding protein